MQTESSSQSRAVSQLTFRFAALAIVFVLLFAAFAAAQSPAPEQATPAPETKVTPQQAEELFRSVDELTRFASEASGLPVKGPIKRKLASRDEVERYLSEKMKDDPDAQRIDRGALTLEKLGLLPKAFDIRKYMLALMREQIAGFYDPKTKTVFLLDWVAPEAQRPVLAHELTHALQDQVVDLERWGEVSTEKLSPEEEIVRDEERTARNGVVEGQAMVVLFDYVLAPLGKSVENTPDLIATMRSEMLNEGATPLLSQAPLLIREEMFFPYRDGMDFTTQVLKAKGKQAAFADVLKNPPADTRQIMEADDYLKHRVVSNPKFADLPKLLGNDWERFDYAGLGEFDLEVTLKQWGARQDADPIAKQWQGGWYQAFRKKNKQGPLCLALALRFETEQAARSFDADYRKGLSTRYKQTAEKNGVIETEEGPVVSEVRGALWLATESFDLPTARKVIDEMGKATGTERGQR